MTQWWAESGVTTSDKVYWGVIYESPNHPLPFRINGLEDRCPSMYDTLLNMVQKFMDGYLQATGKPLDDQERVKLLQCVQMAQRLGVHRDDLTWDQYCDKVQNRMVEQLS